MRINRLGAVMAVALISGIGLAAPSYATNTGQVCQDSTVGKINVQGSHTEITVTASPGHLIDWWCAKAGSVNQGLGPEEHDVDPPAESIVITHSSGKDLSHYSYHEIAKTRPEQPAADREERDVVGEPDCYADTVTTAHQVRTRDYTFSESSWSWVAGDWSDWETVSTSTREATEQECPPVVVEPKTVVPELPVVKDKCGTINDHYGLPSTEGIAYTRDAWDVVATITAENTTWGTLPAGWSKVTDTIARYLFQPDQFTAEPCEEAPTPQHEERTVTGEPDCGEGTITSYVEERHTTVTYDSDTGTYTESEFTDWTRVVGSETTTYVDDVQCPLQTVVENDYSETAPDCKNGTVTWTATATWIPYSWVNGVPTPGTPSVTVKTGTRDATVKECPVVVPPADTPPAASPQPRFAGPQLPMTGSDPLPLLGLAGVLLLLGGASTVVAARARRQG